MHHHRVFGCTTAGRFRVAPGKQTLCPTVAGAQPACAKPGNPLIL